MDPRPVAPPSSLRIVSQAFADHGDIPRRFTGEGENRSPPLAIEGVPVGTKTLALVVDDPDAPDPRAPKRRYVHWVLFNLPPDARALPEGVECMALGADALEGLNDEGKPGYTGPRPPVGKHRYFFTLYALDTRIEPGFRPLDRDALLQAMKGHVLARAETVGTYAKS